MSFIEIPLNRKNDINFFKHISLDIISKFLPLSSEFSADSLRRRYILKIIKNIKQLKIKIISFLCFDNLPKKCFIC